MPNQQRDALGFTMEQRRARLDRRIRERVAREEAREREAAAAERRTPRSTQQRTQDRLRQIEADRGGSPSDIPVSIRQQEETVRQQERAIERLGESPDRLERLRSAETSLERLKRKQSLGLRSERDFSVERGLDRESRGTVTRSDGETVTRETIRLSDGTTVIVDTDPVSGQVLDRRTITDQGLLRETTGLSPSDLRRREIIGQQIISDLQSSMDRVNLATQTPDFDNTGILSISRPLSVSERARISRELLERGEQPLADSFETLGLTGLGGVVRSAGGTGFGRAFQQTVLGTAQVGVDTLDTLIGVPLRSGRSLLDDRQTSFPFFLPTPREIGDAASEIPSGLRTVRTSLGQLGDEIRRDPGLGAGLIIAEVGTGVLPVSGVRGARLARSGSINIPSINLGTSTRGPRQLVLGDDIQNLLSTTSPRGFTRLTPTELRSLGVTSRDAQLTLTGLPADTRRSTSAFRPSESIPAGVDPITGRLRFVSPDSVEGRRLIQAQDPRVTQTGLREFGVRDPIYILDSSTGQVVVRDARVLRDFLDGRGDRFQVLGRSPTPTPVIRRRDLTRQQTLEQSLGLTPSTTGDSLAFATLLPISIPRRRNFFSETIRDRSLFRMDRSPLSDARRSIAAPISGVGGFRIPSFGVGGLGFGVQGFTGLEDSLTSGLGVVDLRSVDASGSLLDATGSLDIVGGTGLVDSVSITRASTTPVSATATRSVSRAATRSALSTHNLSIASLSSPVSRVGVSAELSRVSRPARPRRVGGVPVSRVETRDRDDGGVFRVFTRRRGRKVLVGSSDDLDEAFGLGVGKVQSTLRASFKIETDSPGLQAAVSRRKRELAGTPSFRFGKTLPGWLVEPRSQRLASGDEVSSIQSKRTNTGRVVGNNNGGGLVSDLNNLDGGFF